jgi:hypothetical protein
MWKIGYPSGLGSVSSESEGRALYNGIGIVPITISTIPAGGAATTCTGYSSGNYYIASFDDSIAWKTMRFLDGDNAGETETIASLSSNKIYPSVWHDVAMGDHFELIPSEAYFEFSRNPTYYDFKFVLLNKAERMPYGMEEGYCIPIGRDPDNLVFTATFNSKVEFDSLMSLLTNPTSYTGTNAVYGADEAAPLILETGQNEAHNQFAVFYEDFEIIRQAKKGNNMEVSFTFNQISVPTLRGI